MANETTATSVVARARARLGRIAARNFRARNALIAAFAGGTLAALRPLAWPLAETTPLWVGLARAAGLFTIGGATAWLVLGRVGARRGPNDLASARAVDEALGLHELVASGFAFTRDARQGLLESIAIRRADEVASGVDVARLFPLPRWSPRRAAWFQGALVAAFALIIGAYDRSLVLALVSPPGADEVAAARVLDSAATELAKELEARDAEKKDRGPLERDHDASERDGKSSLVEKAREAAGAARKGDRSRALEKLQDLRAAAGKQASRADDLAATLQKMKESLERPAAGAAKPGATPSAPIEPSKTASEAMRLLAKKMRETQAGNSSQSNEPSERMLERLERAGDEARHSAQERGKNSESARTAKALSQAVEAMHRGDREAAAKMLEEAASRAEAMEKERAAMSAEADAIVDMLEKSGALDQAIQLAMLGREGGQGEDEGNGAGRSKDGQGKGEGQNGAGKPGSGALRAAVMARLAALGVGRQESASGTEDGGHIADRKRAKRDALAVEGSMRAPSQIGEGERAVQAIRGLGRGSEPPDSYREIFPSYDAAAEEGLADERVPARRRAAVRRYFQAIRPDQPEAHPESEKQP